MNTAEISNFLHQMAQVVRMRLATYRVHESNRKFVDVHTPEYNFFFIRSCEDLPLKYDQ